MSHSRRALILSLAFAAATCRGDEPTGLKVTILIDAPLQQKIGALQVVFDTSAGFAMAPGTYEGGKITIEQQNVDGDPPFESVMKFNNGFPFSAAIVFIAAMDNATSVDVTLSAVSTDLQGARVGSGTNLDGKAIAGSLVSVTLSVACDLDACAPVPDGGAPDAAPDGPPGPVITTVDLAADMPQLKVLGAKKDDRLTTVAACDINRDGFSDLVVGAPTAETLGGGPSAGAVYVVFSRPFEKAGERTTFDLSKGHQSFTLLGAAGGDRLGAAVACGDVNGDGTADLVAAAPSAEGVAGVVEGGRVYVVFDKPELDGKTIDLSKPDPVDVELAGAATMARAGSALLAADLDGGAAELVIAAPGASGQPTRAKSGVVHVMKGKPVWPVGLISLAAAGATHPTITGAADAELATALAAGDLDGDGKAELLVGATETRRGSESSPRGAVTVFSGIDASMAKAYDAASTSPADGPALVVWGPAPGSAFGRGLAAVDFTRDGRADILAGAPLTGPAGRPSAGRVYLIPGDTTLYTLESGAVPDRDMAMSEYQAVLTGAADGDHFGTSVAGTTTGASSAADLVVGAPEAGPPGRAAAGAAYRIKAKTFGRGEELDFATVAAVAPHVVVRVWGAAEGNGLGTVVVGGRFNSEDSLGDFFVTAPRAAGAAASSGAGYGFFGRM